MTAESGQKKAGVLSVDKPPGMTSRESVDWVQEFFPDKKVGHAGTLDRLAEGVLPVFVGGATRLISYFQNHSKVYLAKIRFDLAAPTLDLDGDLKRLTPEFYPGEQVIRENLANYRGTISQRPPQYSALKLNGRRASDRVRSGEKIKLATRPVEVYRIELIEDKFPEIAVKIECGKGFYVRALARDLAKDLEVRGGVVSYLSRESYGPYARKDSLQVGSGKIREIELRSPLEAVEHLSKLKFEPERSVRIRHGNPVPRQRDATAREKWLALDELGNLLAIVRPEEREGVRQWQPEKVFSF